MTQSRRPREGRLSQRADSETCGEQSGRPSRGGQALLGAGPSTDAFGNVVALTSGTNLTDQTESRRIAAAGRLDAKRRASWGQFFTPQPLAELMAEMLIEVPGQPVRLLDPGAGVGSLSAAAVAKLCSDDSDRRPIELVVYEIDGSLHDDLSETLIACEALAESVGRELSWDLRARDYILDASNQLAGLFGPAEPEYFSAVIMNPPYRKINGGSPERVALEVLGLRVTNLYTAFLALAAEQLCDGGVVVAITPRSFANGLYFAPFRQFLFARVGIERLHTFEARGALFADAEVLQENVILAARRGSRAEVVELMISRTADDAPERRLVPRDEVLRPGDRHLFLRIPSNPADTRAAGIMAQLPCELHQLGLAVSTGRVVDFRAREHLRTEPAADTAALIYPGHLHEGGVCWPGRGAFRKPNALAISIETEKLLLPNETYVLVRRFTAKEERRRVSAAVSSSAQVPGPVIAFENHLNVFHRANRGLDAEIAAGLAAYLNSSFVDRYVRHFSGHTQINATDLRDLRYPMLEQLRQLGRSILAEPVADQQELDTRVESLLPEAETGTTGPD